MKRTCYPLKRNMHRYEYLLLAGIPAGSAAILYSVFSDREMWGKTAGFFGGLFLIVFGFLTLKTIFQGRVPLSWDQNEFIWYFRKRRWSDLSEVTVLNELTVSSVSEAATEFKRYLVFTGENIRECRIPFHEKDYLNRDLSICKDPVWKEFLSFVEQRFSLAAGSLSLEQAGYGESHARSIQGTTPAQVTWLFGIMGLVMLVIMLVAGMDALGMKCLFGGYLCAVMLIVSIGKKHGWDKVMDFFRMRRK